MKLIRGYVIEVSHHNWNSNKTSKKNYIFLPSDDYGLFKNDLLEKKGYTSNNPLVFFKYDSGVADVFILKSSIPKSYEYENGQVKYYGTSLNILNMSNTDINEIIEELTSVTTQTDM